VQAARSVLRGARRSNAPGLPGHYCTEHKITFTRSRSGNKNDGAHVEQKNWTHVRELVGYLRFDTEKELFVLNEIWALDMGYTNYLLAQQKLVFKQRSGSKVTKRYDRAATPFARTMARKEISETDRARLHQTMSAVRPGELYRQIHDLTTQLERMALTKAPAPVKPQVNRAFNPSLHPEVLVEATNQASRSIDMRQRATHVVAALRSMLERAHAGERVEVGCLGGHGRTGTALACLAILTGHPHGEAVAWVRANYCVDAVETAEQEAFVVELVG
jgi:hypothetical protein